MEFKGLCLGCMNNKGDAMQCPKCGYVDGTPQVLPYLEPGTLLKERYIVGKHLSANGEGVTYIGFDVTTSKKVTVREYLPKTLCSRVKDDDSIIIASGNKLVYQDYLQDFMEIGRALAKLSGLPSVVPVVDMFEANKTAYIIYEFVDGKPLDEIIKRARRFGISPENIIMTRSGTLKLQGFGSPDAHLAETELAAEFYEGFSAIEQYSLEGKKGKWTDVYAMCAVLFYALTGKRPPDAVSRSYEPRLNMPADVAQNIPTHVVTALAGGLQVNIESRTHSMEELKNQLTNPVPRRPEPKPVPAAAPPAAPDYGDRYVDEPPYQEQPVRAASSQMNRPAREYAADDEQEISPYKYGIISGLIGFVVLGVIALICLNLIVIPMMNKNSQDDDDDISSSYVSSDEGGTESEPTVLYRVPKLVNKKWSNVDGNEKYGNFYIRMSEEVYDENYEEGRIISQSVEAGATVAKNTPISVVVSKGSKMRTVPDIIGKNVSDAAKELEQAGLALGDQAEEYSDDVESGKIIRLNGIEPGKKIQAGSMINVVVSLGPED